jgi:membrane-associated protease RseP (regulator of RpoE activity)
MIGKTMLAFIGVFLLATAAFAGDEEEHVYIFSSGGSWLGVNIGDVDAERAEELGLSEPTGVEIRSVAADSPAEEAGLEKEDVILQYRGTLVRGVRQLTRLVRETPAGRKVNLQIFRDGGTRVMEVEVRGRARQSVERGKGHRMHRIVIPHIEMGEIEIPEIDIEIPDIPDIPDIPHLMGSFSGRSSSRLGVMIEDLTEQLGEHFGVEDGEGVLVRSVIKGSRAEDAGLRAGDVIVAVDGDEITDTSDLHMALRERRGEGYDVTVVRDKRRRSMSVAPPEEEDESSRDRADEDFIWIEGDDEESEQTMLELERALAEVKAERAEALVEMERARVGRAAARAHVKREVVSMAAELEDAREASQEAREEIRREIRRAVEEMRRMRAEEVREEIEANAPGIL